MKSYGEKTDIFDIKSNVLAKVTFCNKNIDLKSVETYFNIIFHNHWPNLSVWT